MAEGRHASWCLRICDESLLGREEMEQAPGSLVQVSSAYGNMERGPLTVLPHRGVTASGKSHTAHLVTRQLLHLSSSTHFNHLSSSAARKAQKAASQVTALHTLLSAFGRAKTQANPDATRYLSYTELHFSASTLSSTGSPPGGAIVGARVLAWGLDKSRLTRLRQDERTFHIFYQLLSGASPALLDSLRLDDASDYALLASSSCYRLPSGPFSDDAAMFGVVEDAMRTLGLKERHCEGIWGLLSALLALGNIMFEEPLSARDEAAGYRGGANGLGGMVVDGQEEVRLVNPGMLDRASRLLGVGSEDLKEILMTRFGYVKKEVVSTYLDAKGAARQRDRLVGGLYTLLFAYIVETGNHKLNPEYAGGDNDASPPTTQVVFLDLPGFTTRSGAADRTTLLQAASGGNGFTEFVTNFQDELVHSYTLRHAFEESLPHMEFRAKDGVTVRDSVGLPSVLLESRRVISVLRGGVVSADEKSVMGKKVGGLLGVMGRAAGGVRKGMKVEDEELVKECEAAVGGDSAFVGPVTNPFVNAASPSSGDGKSRTTNFGVVHYAGAVTYGVGANAYEEEWVERDADAWDPGFLRVLRGGDGFIKR